VLRVLSPTVGNCFSFCPMFPLTPTLSPLLRGEGAEHESGLAPSTTRVKHKPSLAPLTGRGMGRDGERSGRGGDDGRDYFVRVPISLRYCAM
jgi:hypothetical protein